MMMISWRRALPWLPSVLYMLLIWALSSQSHPPPLPDLPFHDKGVHFLEYGTLGALYAFAVLRSWPRMGVWKAMAIAVLLTSAWGYLDELHQAFVPGRNSDVFDWVADTLGATVGVALMAAFSRWVRKPSA